MDESTSTVAQTDSSVDTSNTAVDMNTTDTPPAGDTQAEEQSVTPTPGNPEPTGPAPDTTDPTLPDHGIDPDHPINPDGGDLPTNPDPPLESGDIDLKSMSRSERAAYFQSLEQNTRKSVEAAVNAAYQPQAADELTQAYMDEGYSPFEAQVLARETIRDQQAQINEARAEIAELGAGLATDAMSVVQNIPWLNPQNTDSYDKKSTEAASNLYENLCLTKDPNSGQIVEARMTPSQFYGLMDTIRSAGTETARISAQKAAEQQLAAVAPRSSNTTTRERAFDALSASEQRAQLLAKGYNIT